MDDAMLTNMTQNLREVAAAQAAQARGVAAQARGEAAQARAEAAQARAEAAADAKEAAADAREAVQETSVQAGGDGSVITIVKDGKTITLNNASPDVLAQALGIPAAPPFPELPSNDGAYAVGVTGILATAVVVIYGIRSWSKAKLRGATPAQLPADVTQRLARMETAIESVAVEVERISEGQRFTTRLLSERVPMEVPRA
jgi:hypothetical protein